VRIYPPKTIKLLTESKTERMLRDSIVKKVMKEMHMARPEAIETLHYLRVIFENNPDLAAHFTVFLDLDLKEVEFLAGDPEKAKSIWGKSMNIEKKLKERGELEERVRIEAEKVSEKGQEEREEEEKPEEAEEEPSEEELEEAEREIESVGKRKKGKDEKKGKQASLLEFLGKK